VATRNCLNCLICNAPAIPRSPYCPPPARRHHDRERRIALRTAYDARLDVFRWSGAILVLDDPADPFHLCFGEYFPRKWSPLIVSSELFGSLAAGLGPSTSPRRSGSPPCRQTVPPGGRRVRGLGREGPLPARPPPGGASSPSPECVVCKEAGPRAFEARAAACSTVTSAR